ncbi:MAG: outer membrane lipoprotein-sorting protein [candidate division Zixibacteria bacterium]|nr:outer membrane lipoprotein-sorting protein [candidate division Zixibacteria bacterium]
MMKKKNWTGAVFLTVLLATLGLAKTSKKTETPNPISRMIAALGGDKFLNLSAFQLSGRGFLVGKNPVKIDFAQRGGKMRSQIETNFWSSTEVFDGVSGWRRFGAEKPFKLSQSPLALFARNGLLRLQQIERSVFELEKDTVIDKTSCYWIKSLDSTFGELWIFLDQKTFRPKELYSPANGITAGLAAYELMEEVYFPYMITVRRGVQSYLELKLDTVAVNPTLPDSFFTFPEE